MHDEIKKEIIGIGLLGLFLFLFISLLSYYPFDPSLNTVGPESVRNICGRAGSYTSDFFIQLFGVMSYMLVAFILVFAVLYVRKKVPPQLLLLASGLCLFFLSVSALLQILVGKVQSGAW